MVLCGTWSETSVAQSQLTQFWQIPRHRALSYSLWTPFFVSHDYPQAVEPGSTPRPLVQKETWRDSLPIDMLLSAVSVLVVTQSSSETPEGLMNNPVLWFDLSNSLRLSSQNTVSRVLCFVDRASLHNPANKANYVHNSASYIYFFSLHVLGNYLTIIRRNYFIYATLGTCHFIWVVSGLLVGIPTSRPDTIHIEWKVPSVA